MFRGKVRTSTRDVHQHSLCCRSGSEKQGKEPDESRICRSPQVNWPSYHYYLTHHVRTQLSSTDIQNYYNIHSWLDNVVKNNKSEPAVADFETDCVIEEEADSLHVGDDYTSSAHLDQRYPLHVACAKAKSPIKEQKEALLSRQEKIKTLKALLTKHERCTRKETRLKGKDLNQ
ncbi:uncharacterized protein LOC116301223 [Actinia tenebrosa]|uniref:Uncharacterized protein LOC116301223 n=1 Tax=Actinia tenebrosa TaxID=6105 RepID=A0A6P8IHF9_ACTTE|nr:uncharacterized protein LOC116301223 [Actinia tenebrosa]